MCQQSSAQASKVSSTALPASFDLFVDRKLAEIGEGSFSGSYRTARLLLVVLLAMIASPFSRSVYAQVLIPGWTQQSPASNPGQRFETAMTYDAMHNQIVMFSGDDEPNDTWLWNGVNWSQANPATSPSARYNPAIVYDAAHGQVVLFGGTDNTSGNRLNDTWVWDGSTWTEVATTGPTGRNAAVMVFDTAQNNVVLFGGIDTSGTYQQDTWTWNGSSWTQVSSTGPSPRADYSMVYDAARAQVLLFGGSGNSGYLNDTWAWNGSSWTQLSPSTSPSPREAQAMGYNAALGQTVLFGGYNGSYFDDTWVWNGTNWTQTSTPASLSARLAINAMTYDSALGQLVLYGGLSTTDTWEWGLQGNFGGVNVCPSGSTAPAPCTYTQTFTYQVASGGTFGTPQVVTEGTSGLDFSLVSSGTTCTGTVAVGTCTVSATFTPLAPGLRTGAIELTDNSGNILVSTPIYGIGEGPAIVYAPAVSGTAILGGPALESVVTTPGYTPSPRGLAMDAARNLYIADPGNGRLLKRLNNGTVTTVTGPNGPQAIAIDGAGDLFVADTGLQEVLEIPAGCTTAACQFSVYKPSPASPVGVAVDGQGDVFVADSYSHAVVEVPAGCTASSCWVSIGSGWSSPNSVALDAAGNLFVTDSGLSKVVKMPAGCTVNSCQTTVGSGWIYPHGLAIDAAGDVYVSDTAQGGGGQVLEVPAGCATSSCEIVLLNGAIVYNLAADALGQVYAAEGISNQILQINQSQPPTINFDTTYVGYTSDDSPQSFTFQNIGNQTLSRSAPGLIVAGSPFSQTFGVSQLADCTSSFSLAPGAGCNLSTSFRPTSQGTAASVTVFTDNALNVTGAQQVIYFYGPGLNNTQTMSISGAGSGNGSVTSNPTGINCNELAGVSSGACSANFVGGQVVLLQEVPSTGSTFAGWGGACAGYGQNQVCQVTLNAASSAVANFALSSTFPLSVSLNGNGSGSVFDPSQQISCTETSGISSGICSANYSSGAVVTLTASAGTGSIFVGWGGACASFGASLTCSVTVSSAENVTATYLAPGATPAGLLEPITAGLVYGQAGSLTSATQNKGGISAGTLYSPMGIAFDSGGNLYVADRSNNRVLYYPVGSTTATRVYGQNGSLTNNAANNGGISADSLNQPVGLALDSASNLYISDYSNNRVLYYPAGSTTATRVYGQNGSFTTNIANNGGVSANSISAPEGLAVDAAGNLYVSDSSARVLFYPAGSTTATRVYGQNGDFTAILQNNGGVSANSLSNPQMLALDSSGDLYVADSNNNRVLFYPAGSTTATQVYGQAGSLSSNTANNGGVSANSLSQPWGVAVDSSGDLYVSDSLGGRVLFYTFGSTTATRVYGQGGNFTTNAMNNGGVTANSLNQPTGVALDRNGNVYVTDTANNRVLEYGSFGNVSVCPTGQTTPAPCSSILTFTLSAPANPTIGAIQVVTQGATGLDFNPAGGGTCTGIVSGSCNVNVTFAPLAPGQRKGALQIFDNNGRPVASAPISGVGQAPFISFGPAIQTTLPTSGLHYNVGVATDSAGNVYVADYTAGKVVKVTPGGVQTTVPATGLSAPIGVAVDGAGNLFIVDLGLPNAVEITPAGVQTNVGSGLSNPVGIALDATGNVYISDQNNNRVVMVTPGGIQTTVPATGLNQPWGVAVDASGDVFIADGANSRVVEVTPAGIQTTISATGLGQPYGVAVDAAGDILIADPLNARVVEVPAGCAVAACQFTIGTGLNYPSGVALDGLGSTYVADQGLGQVFKINSSQPPSLSFATTNVGSTSTNSPQPVVIQNVGNAPLTGSITLNLGSGFSSSAAQTCLSALSLAPGALCTESFSFTPTSSTFFSGSASVFDNSFNLAAATQTISVSGNGATNGVAGTVAVPNLTGQPQTAAAAPLAAVGLALGTVSTTSSDTFPAGTVINQNPVAGTQVNAGSTVALLVSSGVVQPVSPNPLSLENNYFLTGDYVSAGVTLRGTGVNGTATGTITIPSYASSPTQGVPDGADIIDAFLYWESVENTATASSTNAIFNGYSVTGQQIGNDIPNYVDGTLTGTLRAYRAAVNVYLPVGANGIRFATGNYSVSLPDSGGAALPLTEGASLVLIYRVLSPNFPLKSIILYDGAALPATSATQVVQGFYDAVGGANGTGKNTLLFAANSAWNNNLNPAVTLGNSSQYSAPLNAPGAYAAVLLSTPVNNSDNDGILDAWKSGPGAGNFHAGQPGYYDVKTQTWVGLPGARHGQKDLFVQLDYMCGAVLASGACDPTQENLFPAPDASGNDPLAMVQQAFANSGVQLHLTIGNAVSETTCTDIPTQLCQFPNQSGVIGWKNSLEFSKLWPRNFTACILNGDCSIRFPYGQKDSYHYVLMGHSLAIPAWNTRYGTLTSIVVANGITTIGTTDRGTGINACPSRITLGGVLGNPSLNGVYNTTSCADSKTITVATPGVPNWSYPNSALAEPVIGLTSGTISSISGYSDLGGADSAVTLGLWLTAPNQDMSKKANVIAGTLFHEIGHTLGLSHGGLYYDTPASYVPTFDANCKPNYQSVMNYLFQLDGVGPSQAVAFSNQTLQTLNENSAGSITQLTDGSGNPATFPTSAWYVPYTSGSAASPATLHCDGTPLNGESGYRVDSSIAPITPPWANGQDLSFIGTLQSAERGYNDLTAMDLRQVGATGGEFASLSTVLNFGASSAPLNISAGGRVTVGSGGTVALGSGGTVALGSGGNVTLGSGGTITLGSGGNVTLGSGGNVTLGSGGTVTPGSSGLVTLGSGGNVTLSSGGVITLGSGGTITLGSGGVVTLGSGGVITLGSGGTITVPSTGGTYPVSSGGVITLGSGGNVTLGSGGNLTLSSGGVIALGSGGVVTLGSGGNVTLGSGGVVTLGSGGVIALGSGGNVTLGSGGVIALGSGGVVTLGSGGLVTLGSGGVVTLGSGGTLADGQGGNVTLGSGGEASLGAGGTVTLGSGGVVTLGSGGLVTLGSGGVITLGSGGVVTLGSGGVITLGSGGASFPISAGGSYTFPAGGGTVTLGSGGVVTLGSGGVIALGSGGVVTLGSGGLVTLGSGGVVTLGSGGTIIEGTASTIGLGSVNNITPASGGPLSANELTYETANSVVRPPSAPTETSTSAGVLITWKAPAFGVVQTYTIYRSSNGATPIVIGSVSGVNGNPPATEFTDTNPDPVSQTVVYTVTTTLVPDPGGAQRQSPASTPAVLKNNQSIVLGPLPSSVIVTNPPTITATAMSGGVPNGLQVQFSAAGSCSIGNQSLAGNLSSATVALSSTGSCTITASQPGTIAFNPANSVSGTFMVLPLGSATQSQTITFPSLPNLQYGNTFSLSASTSAGLPVTFSASGPCTTSGTISGVGTCRITASSAGNSTYSAASLTQAFTILPAVLKVTANNLSSAYGQSVPAFTYSYSGFVNGETAAVISGVPALTSTATTSSSVGSYPIVVSTGSLATANYSFLYVNGTLTVQAANQAALTLTTASPLTYNLSESLSVSGGTTNGTLSYAISGPCSITGAQLTANSGTGSCQVTANMAGNSNYNPVSSAPVNVVLAPASQSIAFTTNPPATAATNSSFIVAASATSGLAVTYSSSGSCTDSGATYKIISAGTCSVVVNQSGNSNYAAAPTLIKTTNSSLSIPTVTFTGAPASAAYKSSFIVATTTNASTTAVITSNGSCSNAGNTVTMISGTGTCTLTATWAADSAYSGTSANQSTKATLATQLITFTTNPPASAAYKTSFTVAAASTSSNPVTYTSAGACSNVGPIYTMNAGTGSCSVIANAAANTNYATAAAVTKTVTATQAAPTVTFTGAPLTSTYLSKFTVTSTTNGSVAALVTSSGACSNSGNTVTMTSGTGTCSLTATWAAGGNYSGAVATQSTTATPLAQTIAFTTNPPASSLYGASFTVAATGGASGNAVIYTSAGACRNSGATYTMTNSTGVCSVSASQAGNTNYAPATPVTKLVTATGPLLSVSPSSISFGTVYFGSISTQTIVITNIGTAPTTINEPILSLVKGGNSNEFIALSLCPKSLAVGKSCPITIAFLAGPYYTPQTATLQLMSNAPGSPLPITLSATVINPQAVLSSTSLNFGTIKHATSSTINVKLSNPGASPLSITGLRMNGTSAASFGQTNNCGSTLAAGASCTIAVKFAPVATGSFSANLSIVDNAQSSGGTQIVSLAGKAN